MIKTNKNKLKGKLVLMIVLMPTFIIPSSFLHAIKSSLVSLGSMDYLYAFSPL